MSQEYYFDSASRPTLRYGSRGIQVRNLQRRLNVWLARMARPRLRIDGIFGPRVESAVEAFQRAMGLTVDGIVGQRTHQALQSLHAGPPSSPRAQPGAGPDRWILPPQIRAAGERQFVRYDRAPLWAGGRNCTRVFTPGAAELRNYILRNFPGVRSIGGYSCRPNTASPGRTSVHGTGRAIDIVIPLTANRRANSAVGDPIANWLVQNAAAIGIQFIIWNGIQWNGSQRGRKDGLYPGPVPHTDHIHVELNLDGAARRTAWFLNRIQ